MGLYEFLVKHIDRKKEKKLKKQLNQDNQLEAKEIKRFKRLLHIYFDEHGKGLKPAEIKEVNEYIKETMVLSDEREINSFTTLALTYLTVAKKKFTELQQDILKQLDGGAVVDKADAVLVSKNVIINKPQIEKHTYVNGVKKVNIVSPEKIYTLNIKPEISQCIISKKYEDESIDAKKYINSAIEKYSEVKVLAYNIPDRNIM